MRTASGEASGGRFSASSAATVTNTFAVALRAPRTSSARYVNDAMPAYPGSGTNRSAGTVFTTVTDTDPCVASVARNSPMRSGERSGSRSLASTGMSTAWPARVRARSSAATGAWLTASGESSCTLTVAVPSLPWGSTIV